MEEWFSPIYADGALLALWGALLFHLILPIPHHAHPAQLWHKFAALLANKVNQHHNHSQSVIAGTLAFLLMMLPSLLIMIAALPLVWEPVLFEMALLILALEWRSSDHFAKQLILSMTHEDKARSRLLMQDYLNRETAALSTVGIGKAGAETLIMRYGRNVVCVLFWYLLLGGIGAFGYRLAMELARAWSPSRQRFRPFGLPAIRVVAILEVVPMRLFSLLLLTGRNGFDIVQITRQQAKSWPLPGPAWLLCIVGNKLQLALGGPALYDGRRAERAKVGGRIVPSAMHLSQIQHLLFWRVAIWITAISLLLALFHQGL